MRTTGGQGLDKILKETNAPAEDAKEFAQPGGKKIFQIVTSHMKMNMKKEFVIYFTCLGQGIRTRYDVTVAMSKNEKVFPQPHHPNFRKPKTPSPKPSVLVVYVPVLLIFVRAF